jgi:hypothetical protein
MTEARTLRVHGDMASCAKETCQSFKAWWRAQKPASVYRQSFTMFTPVRDRCDSFIGIAKHD